MSTRAAREGAAGVAVFLYLIVCALLLIAGLCSAGDTPVNPKTVPLASAYDLQSTSYIYCYTLGKDGHVRGDWNAGVGFIKTSGSSTTTVSNTTSGAALTGVVVGDELMIMVSGAPVRRYVTAVASVESITVNAAWDLSSGTGFYIRHRTCATGATAGWFRVAELSSFSIEVKITTFAAASIDTQVECRSDDVDTSSNIAYTQHYTSTAADVYVLAPQLGPVGDECRIGLKTTTPSSTQAVTLNLLTR